jgi:shikimate O-hydroxycinnamoyltransferase
MSDIDDTQLVRPASMNGRASTWELTELDRANMILLLRGTWVFDRELDVSRLRAGLGELLVHYPHLAGRMRAAKTIDLNGQGVPFTVASASEVMAHQIDERSQDHVFIDRFSRPLVMSRVKRGRAAPMTVTLTRIGDGHVLGVRCSHACLDGDGFYSMVRNWARLCAGQTIEPPVLDQSVIPGTSERSKGDVVAAAKELGWRKISPLTLAAVLPDYVLGRLHVRAKAIAFSPQALRRLKEEARRSSGGLEITTNEALSAHLTLMCTALHGLAVGTACEQVTVLNFRERLRGVPANFAGNASFTHKTADFKVGLPFGELAAMTHERLGAIRESGSFELLRQVEVGLDLMRHRVLMSPYDLAGMHSRRPTTTYINNFSKLPIYDLDFGVEGAPARPILAIPHNLPDPVLIWPVPPDRGGVEVYLTGVTARAAMRLGSDDPWWSEMRRFDLCAEEAVIRGAAPSTPAPPLGL